MTERTSPFDPSSQPPPPRRSSRLHAGDPELRDVVERATRVRDGLALLRSAPLECAAVLLGAAPPAIERARAALEEPGVLEDLASLFAGAAGHAVATRPPRPPAPRDPEQLIDAARQRADGLSLLLLAAPEAAAIAFGVHPDLVHDAREVAARRADLSRN